MSMVAKLIEPLPAPSTNCRTMVIRKSKRNPEAEVLVKPSVLHSCYSVLES